MESSGRWRAWLRYQVDNLFSSGPLGLTLGLAVVSLIIIALTTAILVLTGVAPADEQPYSLLEAAWLSLISTLGEGSIGGRETAWGFRWLMLGVTLGSIFFVSALIGILTNGIHSRLEDLRKGRSLVIEDGHTVILGWSEQIFTILPELIIANASQPRSYVVILGEHDKVDMEDQIRHKIGDTGRTRIVCRTGSPMEMTDLRIANLNAARSIIVLTPEGENPDAEVIKTVLAITRHPHRRPAPYHIVASIRNPKNVEVAEVVGKDEVEWVRGGDIVARIIAQTCRQSGLSVVYNELLDFSGDEIYFYQEPALAGKTFAEAVHLYRKDCLIGLSPANGGVQLNPPKDTVIQAGDHLLMIAKDNNLISLDGAPSVLVQEEAIAPFSPLKRRPEHTLILGWNWRGPGIIRELDQYVAPGSDVLVVADREGIERNLSKDCQELKNQQVCYRHADTTDRDVLEGLGLDHFDHVILLCYSDRLDVQKADALTLISLLHLRDLAEQRGYKYSIVTEMLDARNYKLAVVTRADDFIVSDRLISLMMAQVAENKGLNAVFNEIFNPEGSEIYLRPAGAYVRLDQPVNFYTVIEAAQRRDEVAIGYRRQSLANDAQQAYGVVINPDKALPLQLSAQDRIIVLAKS